MKSQKRPNIRAAFRQAVSDTTGGFPVVFSKADREEWLVTMDMRDWAIITQLWFDEELRVTPYS